MAVLMLTFASCDEQAKDARVTTEPVKIEFNFLPDSTYRYSIKNNIVVTQEIDEDNSITINQNLTLVSSYKVLSKKGGNRTLSVTYDRITMSSGNEVFSLDYDSEADDGSDIIYEGLRNLIDKTYKITVSEKGRIVDAEQLAQQSGAENNAYNISDSSLKAIMLHAFEVYPGKMAQAGDIWENSYETSIGFANVRVKNKYRLLSVTDDVARIELQGRITSDKTAQVQNSLMLLNGSQSGTFEVVVESGLVQSAKIKQVLSGEMGITGKNTPVSVESDIYIMGATIQR